MHNYHHNENITLGQTYSFLTEGRSHISPVTSDCTFLKSLESTFILPGIFKPDTSTPKDIPKTSLSSLIGPLQV